MPITLQCDCGKGLRVKDEHAGRKVRCPACQGVLEVPVPITPIKEDEPPVMEMITDAPSSVPVQPTPPPLSEEDDEDDSERQRKRRILPGSVTVGKAGSKRRRNDDDDFDPPPIAKPSEGWFGNANAGVLGGFGMILLALLWFFGGLAVGIIFWYPIVLFVVGIIAVIKGLVSGE